LENDCENANTLAHDGETLVVLAHYKGGEKGEEKEAKLGSRCCPRGHHHALSSAPPSRTVTGWRGREGGVWVLP
jgi:hypothetical protein